MVPRLRGPRLLKQARTGLAIAMDTNSQSAFQQEHVHVLRRVKRE